VGSLLFLIIVLVPIFDRRSRKRFVTQENLGRNPHSAPFYREDQEDENEDEDDWEGRGLGQAAVDVSLGTMESLTPA
jgi:hypothetical protein